MPHGGGCGGSDDDGSRDYAKVVIKLMMGGDGDGGAGAGAGADFAGNDDGGGDGGRYRGSGGDGCTANTSRESRA